MKIIKKYGCNISIQFKFVTATTYTKELFEDESDKTKVKRRREGTLRFNTTTYYGLEEYKGFKNNEDAFNDFKKFLYLTIRQFFARPKGR